MTTPLAPSTSTVREPVRLQDLTPEQHERLAAYRAMVARGIPADSAKKAVRQQFAPAPDPTGYGKAALRGVPRGVFGTLAAGVNAAVNPVQFAADEILKRIGLPNPQAQQREQFGQMVAGVGNDLADRIAPAPTGLGPQLTEAASAGATAGLPFGGLGMASGALSGAATEGGLQAGLPTPLALLLGLGAGLVPAGAMRLAAGRGPMGAASAFERAAQRDDGRTAAQVLRQPADAETMGMARTGRAGSDLAQRVASAGGDPADVVGQAAQDRLTQYEQVVRQSRTAEAERVAQARAQERSVVDYARAQERSAVRGAREANRGERAVVRAESRAAADAAQRNASGDQIAARFERAVGSRHRTLLQYERMAEQDLQNTGRRVFGALEREVGEIAPSEATRPLYEALSDPLVKRTFERFSRTGSTAPSFDELQKTYQSLGAQVRQAARNGGALADGTLMTDLRAARETFSQAMEQSIPGFRAANAAYRARAVTLEALDDGYAAGRTGKPADIQDELQRLATIDPDAVQAHLVGQRLAFIDQLREMPSTKAATERFLAPGSDMAERLRLAFPDEASYTAFRDQIQGITGARGQPGVALERGLTDLRKQLQQQVDEIAQRGTQQRAQLREVAAREVADIRGRSAAERRAIPAEDIPLMRTVSSASKRLPVEANTESTRAGADVLANRVGPARRDILLTWLRNKSLSRPVRERLARVLTLKGQAFEQEAAQLLQDLETLRSIVPRGVGGVASGVVATDATRTRRGSRPDR